MQSMMFSMGFALYLDVMGIIRNALNKSYTT